MLRLKCFLVFLDPHREILFSVTHFGRSNAHEHVHCGGHDMRLRIQLKRTSKLTKSLHATCLLIVNPRFSDSQACNELGSRQLVWLVEMEAHSRRKSNIRLWG